MTGIGTYSPGCRARLPELIPLPKIQQVYRVEGDGALVSVQGLLELIDLQNNNPIPIPSFHLPIPIFIRQPNNFSFPITLIPSLIIDRCGSKVHLCQFLAHSNIFLSLVLESQWGGGSTIHSAR